ncbi:hypothetical protein [Hyphomonas sp. KY3]|uniref:hypothetical protein n=1 Tax=Hyphomonas sp. KY3 TaxID=2016196 RepID=UPI001A8C7860|nr:hypothetical protein [Hyphomonas sp. KY3]QSR23095.1 hypothetical protein CFA77_12410 [Hyphomonas sp. KY3]
MKIPAVSLRARLEGALILLALAGLAWLLLAPRILAIKTSWQALARSETLTRSHVEDLSRPLPANPHDVLRTYVSKAASEESATDLNGNIQAGLIDLVRQKQARLVDLKQIAPDERIADLTGLRFSLQAEGDIQAMLELVDAIGMLEAPILVDELDLRPLGFSQRPDQRMRLSLTLSAWTGDL